MKCILLAAGYATRLYPLTEDFPKPLLKEDVKLGREAIEAGCSGSIKESRLE